MNTFENDRDVNADSLKLKDLQSLYQTVQKYFMNKADVYVLPSEPKDDDIVSNLAFSRRSTKVNAGAEENIIESNRDNETDKRN